MNRRYKKRSIHLKETIFNHIEKNIKNYLIVTLIFIIGIIIGVIFINNLSENQSNEINEYIDSYTNNLKERNNINETILLKKSLQKNLLLAILIWFIGSTVIGISIMYLIILFRGFCLGYTISVFILYFGTWKGMQLIFASILLQNIVFIPAIMLLGVSGMNLYNSIMKDKRKENIKLEIIRHTLVLIVAQIFLCFSSMIEVFVSKNLLQFFIKYI